MLDAVTFDLGGARPPLFVFPDASGLAPLTLPDEFLRGQGHQPPSEFPSDTVRRFETAMSTEQPLSPSVVESLMASVISERPNVEGQKVESQKAENRKVEVVAKPVTDLVGTAPRAVRGGRGATALPDFATVRGGHAGRVTLPSARETLQQSQVIVQTPAEPTVVIEQISAKPVEKPVIASAEKPAVVAPDKPVVVTVERPVAVATPAAPTVAAVVIENPDDPVKAKGHSVAASNTPIIPDAPATRTDAMVEAPVAVDKPIGASVEVVEKNIAEMVGTAPRAVRGGRGATALPDFATVRGGHAGRVTLPSARETLQQSQVIVQTPAEPTVVIEKAPVLSVERPVIASVEKPMVEIGDRPTVATVEVPTVVAVEKPVAIAPSPTPTVVPAPAITVAAVVIENPDDPVKAEGHPVTASNTPIIPDAPVRSTGVMVEAPAAVDKPIGVSVEATAKTIDEMVGTRVPRVRGGRGATALPDFATVRGGHAGRVTLPSAQEILQPSQVIVQTPVEQTVVFEQTPVKPVEKPVNASVEKPVIASAEKPVVVAPDKPVIASAEKPVVRIGDRPPVVTVEVPTVAAVEKPVAVVPPAAPTVAPSPPPTVVPSSAPTVAAVVIENPDDPVKAKGHSVAASNTPIIPDAPATRTDAMVEAPVAVDKPIGASVEVVEKTIAEMVGTAPRAVRGGRGATALPDFATVRGGHAGRVTLPSAQEFLQPSQVIATTPAEPTVVIEKTTVLPVEKPTVVTVERPVVVAPDKPTVVTVERPVVVASLVQENPDDPVKAEGHSVAASNTPIIPDAPATRTDAMVEAPVAVDKPIGASVEVVEKTIAEMVGTAPRAVRGGRGATALPGFPAVRSGHAGRVTLPSAQEVLQPSPVSAKTPVEQTVVFEQTPVKPVEKPVNASVEKPVGVSAERPVAAKVPNPTVATVEKPEEKAVAAAAHVVASPAAVEAPTPQVLQAAPEVAAASAASARTEVIVETVNQIVEAVVGQILITPGITQGECEIKIMLKPTVLDGSEITLSAKDGTLTVGITPATQEASAAAAAALPRLEIALAEHAPAFHHVSVALQLKKGNRNEAV